MSDPGLFLSVENLLPQRNLIELVSISPDSSEGSLIKLNNQIKHLEFNISQNQKRGEMLSKECYNLLRSTELLAFDFLFADYLLGETDAQTVYSFFERCIHPNFNLSSIQDANFENASLHVSYLQEVIKTHSQNFFQRDLKCPNIPKRTSQFVLYLKDQKSILERKIQSMKQNASENDQNNDTENKEVLKIYDVNLENKEDDLEESGSSLTDSETESNTKNNLDKNIDSSDLPISFTKWIAEELNVGLNNPTKESLEVISLIKSIAYKLSEIAQLNGSINELKKKVIDPKNIDYSSCSPEDIEQSPFFIGVKNNCQFLMAAFNTMKSQENLIPLCFNALESCRSKLLSLSESYQKSINAMQEQITKIKESISQRQKTSNSLINDLQPFIDIIFMKYPLPDIPHERAKMYDEIEARLKKELDSNSSNQEIVNKINEQLDALNQIKDKRKSLIDLYDEQVSLIQKIEEKDKSILSLIMDFCKAEIEEKLHNEELEQLRTYEENLKNVLDMLKFKEMGEWCDKLSEIGAGFANAAVSQNNIIKDMHNLLGLNNEPGRNGRFDNASTLESKIAAKKKEIEELSFTNYTLTNEISKMKLELNEIIDEQYRLEHDLQISDEWLPDYIDKNNPEQIKKYKEKILCPVCKANRRNTILTSCGHPICRSCVDKANYKCPICSKHFDNINVKPFFLQ